MSRTLDMTSRDYAFTPVNGGLQGRIAGWDAYRNAAVPAVGDALILRNPGGRVNKTSRYRVMSVRRPMDVEPPTMWMADLEFWPRTEVED
jgi:hypothetical protein